MKKGILSSPKKRSAGRNFERQDRQKSEFCVSSVAVRIPRKRGGVYSPDTVQSPRFLVRFERKTPCLSTRPRAFFSGAERPTVRKTYPSFAFSDPSSVSATTAAIPRDSIPMERFSRLVNAWIDAGDIGGHSERTTENRRSVFKSFLWFLGRREFTEIGKPEVSAFLVYLRHGHKEPGGRFGIQRMTKPLSSGSIRTYYLNLAAFFNWCVAEGECLVSPMHTIPPPIDRPDQVMPFSEQEITALKRVVERRLQQARASELERSQGGKAKAGIPTVQIALRDVAFFYLLYDTGMRVSELCELRIGDVEMTDRRITIREGKGGKARAVYFSPDTKRHVTPLIHKNSSPEDYLFTSLRGQTPGDKISRVSVLRTITRWCNEAGITAGKKGPHRFRHAQPLDSPVLTPGGWRTMGELSVGDFVIGSDGKPTEVLGVYPQGPQRVVRMVFNDHCTAECTLDHLWTVWEPAYRRWPRYPIIPKTLSTQEIIEGGKRWLFPLVDAVEFAKNSELPIDPYTLGALLGDGHIGSNLVLTGGEKKREVLERVEKALPKDHQVTGGNMLHRLSATPNPGKGNAGPHSNKMLAALRDMGLGDSRCDSKFIPPDYLLASVPQRIALLQGLMDTDGTATETGAAEFGTISERLAKDIAELTRSLGGQARIRKTTPYKGAKNPMYRIAVRTPFCPFLLTAKRDRYESSSKMPFVRSNVRWEEVDTCECVCIRVANPDCLYVTSDYVLTHNTFAVQFLRNGGDVFTLKEILGHTSLTMTNRYVALANADIQRQHAKFSPVQALRRGRQGA